MRALAVDCYSSSATFNVNYNYAVKIWGNVFADCCSGKILGFTRQQDHYYRAIQSAIIEILEIENSRR